MKTRARGSGLRVKVYATWATGQGPSNRKQHSLSVRVVDNSPLQRRKREEMVSKNRNLLGGGDVKEGIGEPISTGQKEDEKKNNCPRVEGEDTQEEKATACDEVHRRTRTESAQR